MTLDDIKKVINQMASAKDVTEIGENLDVITDEFVSLSSQVENLSEENATLCQDNDRIREINGRLMLKVGEKLEVNSNEEKEETKSGKNDEPLNKLLESEDFINEF